MNIPHSSKPLVAFAIAALSIMLAASANGQLLSGDYNGFKWDTYDYFTAEIYGYDGAGGAVTIPSYVDDGFGDYFFVTAIGDNAFSNCVKLTGVTIPGGVTSIGTNAFIGCSKLTSVTISDGVTSIGDFAFVYCSILTNVTIPQSVTSIGFEPFSLSGVTVINVNSNNPVYSSLDGVLCDKSQTTLIEYPGGNFIGGFRASYTVPDSITTIAPFAFGHTVVTNVIIGDNTTVIGPAAFFACQLLTSVYFQGNAPSVSPSAFDLLTLDPATLYHLPGTTGWPPVPTTFAGCPTALWTLPYPVVLNNSPSLGAQTNGFSFTISWATNISVIVEASTNLTNPVWTPVATNTLTSGTNHFSDLTWTNYPGRFYRISSQ
jgi:BspA type Leucine rich repeat region (6 copies)